MATITNTAAIVFGTATEASTTDITHYVIKHGTTVVVSDTLTGGATDIEIGTPIRIPAGDLDFEIPQGTTGWTAAGVKAVADHYFLSANGVDLTISLHTGAPGANGDANEVTVAGYSEQTVAAGGWTTAE